MKRVDFTITSEDRMVLREPGFVEDCSELPMAIMRAMEDFLEAHGGELALPLTIRVQPHSSTPTC